MNWVEDGSLTRSITRSIVKLENKLPSIEVIPTALAQPVPLTLTYDLDLQSPASSIHDLLTGKSSRSTVSRFAKIEWNRQTDWGDCITSRANTVGKVMPQSTNVLRAEITRGSVASAILEVPRDALSQLKFCQLLHSGMKNRICKSLQWVRLHDLENP